MTNLDRIKALEAIHPKGPDGKRTHDPALHTHETEPPPPPPPVPTTLIYGPALASHGKDNRIVGWVGREVAHRWTSAGGRMTAYAYNERTGSGGYGSGDGGLYELALYRCDSNGFPGTLISKITHHARTAGSTGAENRDPIPWSADIPAGLVCITHRNISADPAGNWCSANELWSASPTTPRQPLSPDDSLAVLSKGEYGSTWSVVRANTPVFQVTFTDHVEGQGYHERMVPPQEIVTARFRERFTPKVPLNVTAVHLFTMRMSGTRLTATLAGKSVSVGISDIPVSTSNDGRVYTGGRWVDIPLAALLPANVEQTCEFTTDGGIRSPLLRQTAGEPGTQWSAGLFTDGLAEKYTGSWEDFYFNGVMDLMWYLS